MVEISLLNKTFKFDNPVLATKLIFCNIPKSNEEIPLLFVEGIFCDLNLNLNKTKELQC